MTFDSQWWNSEAVFATHLQYLDVNTLTNAECRRRFDDPLHLALIHDETLCAFAQHGQGICFGDIGDPLISNGQIIGIASWGRRCGLGVPDLYARVSAFSNWIQEVSGVVAT